MVEFLLLCTTSADGLTSHVHMLVSLYSVFLRMPFELETKMSVNTIWNIPSDVLNGRGQKTISEYWQYHNKRNLVEFLRSYNNPQERICVVPLGLWCGEDAILMIDEVHLVFLYERNKILTPIFVHVRKYIIILNQMILVHVHAMRWFAFGSSNCLSSVIFLVGLVWISVL